MKCLRTQMALYIPPPKTNTGQNVLFFFEPKICVRLFYLTTVGKMFNVFFHTCIKEIYLPSSASII